MARWVLDSFAILAYLRGEPAAQRVAELLEGGATGTDELYVSAVNLGEVLYNVERVHGKEKTGEVLATIDAWPLRVAMADRQAAVDAAELKAEFRLHYSDCFAAALALGLDATLVTGDQDFRRVQALVAIDWLPQRSVSA